MKTTTRRGSLFMEISVYLFDKQIFVSGNLNNRLVLKAFPLSMHGADYIRLDLVYLDVMRFYLTQILYGHDIVSWRQT